MKELMIAVTNRVYTFLSNLEDPEFLELMSYYDGEISRWDTPVTDRRMLNRRYLSLLREMDAGANQS
ncbi:hypothetical protein [Roseobacter sp. S98]|uniref:hypothetical protein n=1 Tax=Roseobacter algicola (ex Choi et al. 2025) (nom. illeg.) TaxID=3092138 RepID=UPI0035C77C54